jgi:two-component system, NarL family, sensor histidine kinase UhpB
LNRIQRAWTHASILYKLLIGNAIVILSGAIVGTYVTKRLLEASDLYIALSFASVGILLSLAINYLILRTALRPLDALQHMVERIDRGDATVRAPVDEIGDPQLRDLARALNTMLERLAAHTRMLEMNRAQLRQLSGQVLGAQEDERKRIARELHDDTSGALARILLNIEVLEDLLPENDIELRAKIRATRTLTEQTLENVRKIIFDLRPTLLDDLGLAAAVHWYAKSHLELANVQLNFEVSNDLGRASAPVETAMFRIAQEAITNIIRHANAKRVRIQLSREQAHWVLIVQDDGRGFNVNKVMHESSREHRWGLFGVQERTALLGGIFRIESHPDHGATLRVEIPMEGIDA